MRAATCLTIAVTMKSTAMSMTWSTIDCGSSFSLIISKMPSGPFSMSSETSE